MNQKDLASIITEAIAYNENVVNKCDKVIERITHPEVYGCCLDSCNSIVINKERMMVVTTDEKHMTTYEFSPIEPTYFTPKAAKRIVEADIYTDVYGDKIELEIVGKLEYYQLLKASAEKALEVYMALA